LDRVKRSYEVSNKLCDDARAALEKADKDLNMTKGQVDKLREEFKAKTKKVEDSDAEYQSILKKTNEAQQLHYTKELPSAIDILQSLEEKRVDFIKETFESFTSMYSISFADIQENLGSLKNTCLLINKLANHQQFVQNNKRSQAIPADIIYEKYDRATKPKAKSSSKSNIDEVPLEKLSPQKGLKKANQRIKELDKEIIEAEKKLARSKTLYEAYKSQSMLAQVQSIQEVQNQIEDFQSQLDSLRTKKHQYECYEAFITSKPAPSSPVLYSPKSSLNKIITASANNLGQSTISFNAMDNSSKNSLVDILSEKMNEEVKINESTIEVKEFDKEEEIKPNEEEYEVEYVNQKFRSLYEYAGDVEAEELSFGIGEELTVIEKENSGWWKARNKDGKEGYVPHNYLEVDQIE